VARSEGREPDLFKVELYGRLSDRQRRLADPLGWQRPPPRDVTPTLAQIAEQIEAEKRASAEGVT
jgi:hypothetical protein